jgi:hypothetical protein
MIAGTLEIQMLANMAQLTADMGKAKGIVGDTVKSIESMLGAIGVGFSATMLLDKINSVADGMDKLRMSSEKTGASIESLSQLQFFAGVSGGNIDTVTQALVKLSKAEAASSNVAAPATQALKFLGLSAKDAAGNLKEPSVLYGEIAQQLYGYADGAGKTALAVALMGKAGAEQLPAMKAMVELGPVEATTTAAQAAAAKEYALQMALLSQQSTILWNTVVTAVLPSMESFVKVLLEGAKETDSLEGQVKGLAADHSIEDWADAGLMGLARLIDVLKTIPNLVSAVTSSFKVVWADITVASKTAQLTSPGALAGAIITGKNPLKEFADALDQRNKILADAGVKYDKLWNAEGNSFEKAMQKQIAARKAANPPGAGPWSGPVDQFGQPITKPQANFDATGGAQAGKNAAAYAAYVKAQQDALTKTMAEAIASAQLLLDQALAHNMVSYQDYYAQREVLERKDAELKISAIQVSIVAEQKSVNSAANPAARYTAMAKLVTLQGNLNKAQEDESRIGAKTVLDYTDAWRKYYLDRNTLEQQLLTGEGKATEAYVIGLDKQWTDELKKMTANSDTAGLAIANSLIRTGLVTAQLADVTTAFGRSQTDLGNQEKAITLAANQGLISEFEGRQRILTLRQSFLPQMQAELDALNLIDKSVMTPDQIQRAVALKQGLDDIATSASTVNRTFQYGATNAIGEYLDAATNAAAAAKTAFTDAFKNMEDALVTFMQTGKLNFKTFADSVIADIIRIQVRQNITGPLASNVGGAMSWLGNILGPSTQAAAPVAELAFAAGGGPVSAGSPYVVGEQGPEMFVPSTSGNVIPNSSMGGVTVTNVFTISGTTDTRSQAQIAAAAGLGVQRAMARNN